MRKNIIPGLILSVITILSVSAQTTSYPFIRETYMPAKRNWKPDTKTAQRYTIAVHPFHLINNGLKFDFEFELKTPGEWIQIGLLGYVAPERGQRRFERWWGSSNYDNPRSTFNSSFDDYNRMWGIGVSALYKKMWHDRGWYFSTGLMIEYFSVGQINYGYRPFQEDGLTFYRQEKYLKTTPFVKPTIQFNVGKHFSFSPRVFMDIFIGISASYSIYDRESFKDTDYDYEYEYYHSHTFGGMYGFGRRGFNAFNCGVRFGVLLWNKQ